MTPDFMLLKYNYWVVIALMLIGMYGVIAKQNLMKKIMGLRILQTSIILFFISTGYKESATIPILPYPPEGPIQVNDFMNPLPHVLMLTAIVVGVATTGVALALALKIFQRFGTLEEPEILRKIADSD